LILASKSSSEFEFESLSESEEEESEEAWSSGNKEFLRFLITTAAVGNLPPIVGLDVGS